MNELDERAICEKLAEKYSSGEKSTRKELRHRARMVYICKADRCILGAVMVDQGYELWLYRQDVAVGTISEAAIRRARAEGAPAPSGRGPMVRDYGPGSREGEWPLWVVPERIADARDYGTIIDTTRGLRLTGVPLRFLDGGELEHSHVNCRHIEETFTLDRIEDDLATVARRKGNIIAI